MQLGREAFLAEAHLFLRVCQETLISQTHQLKGFVCELEVV